MIAAGAADADVVALVQVAARVRDVAAAPREDVAALDFDLRIRQIQRADRWHDRGERFDRRTENTAPCRIIDCRREIGRLQIPPFAELACWIPRQIVPPPPKSTISPYSPSRIVVDGTALPSNPPRCTASL